MCSPFSQNLILQVRRHTVRLVTYSGKSQKPVAVGTGILVRHDTRVFTCTNAHVLEKYYALLTAGDDPRLQVAPVRTDQGLETHHGYLLMPNNKPSTVLGVESQYDHYDVAIIELASADFKEAEFIDTHDFCENLPDLDSTLLVLGFPYDRLEFDGFLKTGFPEPMALIDLVMERSEQLVIMKRPRGGGGTIGGQSALQISLHGISGGGAFDRKLRFVGLIWGGCEARRELYVCPSTRVLHCITEYLKRRV